MNDSLAYILGIIVDGGTIVYVAYKSGRWVLENREKLIRRGQHLHVTITDRVDVSDNAQVLTGGASRASLPPVVVVRSCREKQWP
jgi:hypothetical protein